MSEKRYIELENRLFKKAIIGPLQQYHVLALLIVCLLCEERAKNFHSVLEIFNFSHIVR